VRTLHGDRVFLNLGTHAAVPDIPAFAPPNRLRTQRHSSSIAFRPFAGPGRRLCWAEFAQAFVRFGSRVTVLERGPQLLPREDKRCRRALSSFSASMA